MGIATFKCSATGNPIPKVTWIKDGITVASGDTLSFVAYRNKSGEYWCSADNGLGQAENSSAHLYVHCKYTVSLKFHTMERDREGRGPTRNYGFQSLYILQGRKITVR